MKSRVQVIFFDAAGTLFHVKGSVEEIYLRYAENYGVKRTDDSLVAVRAAFARAFREAPPPVFSATEAAEIKQCERLWWFDIVHHVFYRVGMFAGFDDFFEEIFGAFEGAQCWTLYPETVEVLKKLKEEGLELGIVSNFDSRLFQVLRSLGIRDFFDTITIASLAHAAKPAAEIFRVALRKHAVDPEEAVHVGDSVQDDVEGARNAGMTGVLIERESDKARPPIPIIHNLQELRPLLAAL
ncbi:MAG: HAD-IA family hydrolase [Nitrospiraceae bacterium]